MLSLLSLVSFGWYYYLFSFILNIANTTKKWYLEKGHRQILGLTLISLFSWCLLEGNNLVIKRPLSEVQSLDACRNFPWLLLISRALASPCSRADIRTWVMTGICFSGEHPYISVRGQKSSWGKWDMWIFTGT